MKGSSMILSLGLVCFIGLSLSAKIETRIKENFDEKDIKDIVASGVDSNFVKTTSDSEFRSTTHKAQTNYMKLFYQSKESNRHDPLTRNVTYDNSLTIANGSHDTTTPLMQTTNIEEEEKKKERLGKEAMIPKEEKVGINPAAPNDLCFECGSQRVEHTIEITKEDTTGSKNHKATDPVPSSGVKDNTGSHTPDGLPTPDDNPGTTKEEETSQDGSLSDLDIPHVLMKKMVRGVLGSLWNRPNPGLFTTANQCEMWFGPGNNDRCCRGLWYPWPTCHCNGFNACQE